jgi:hypothetical protein
VVAGTYSFRTFRYGTHITVDHMNIMDNLPANSTATVKISEAGYVTI